MNLSRRWDFSALIPTFRQFLMVGGVQIFIQAIGMISGFIIVRSLSVSEYALYTITNNVVGAMSILANSGVSTGVYAIGQKVWNEPSELGKVIYTGMAIRQKFAAFVFVVGLPVLGYLLYQNGASWTSLIIIVATIIPAFYSELSGSILSIAPRLHQQILPLQYNQLHASIIRLFLVGMLSWFFPFAAIVNLAAGCPQIISNIKLEKLSKKYIQSTQQRSSQYQNEILGFVRKILPLNLYYCFSSQITAWLITWKGETVSIAGIGALGRFQVIFTLLTTVLTAQFIPKFSRLELKRKVIGSWLMKFVTGASALVFLSCIVIFLFKTIFLQLLGPAYRNYESELLIMSVASGISVFTNVLYGLMSSRGWLMSPAISISTSLISIALIIYLVNPSTVAGALYFGLIQAISQLLLIVMFTFKKVRRIEL